MDFYLLRFQPLGGHYEAVPDPYPTDWEAFLMAPVDPQTPIRYKIVAGKRPGEIMSSGSVWSDRLIDILQSLGATGFHTHAIEIVHGAKRMTGYHGVRITGRGGPFDDARSDVDRQDGGIIYGHSAIYMDERSWDGSDVFTIPGLGMNIFFARPVAEVLMKEKLRGITLTLNSECRSGTKDPPPTPPPESSACRGAGGAGTTRLRAQDQDRTLFQKSFCRPYGTTAGGHVWNPGDESPGYFRGVPPARGTAGVQRPAGRRPLHCKSNYFRTASAEDRDDLRGRRGRDSSVGI